MATILTAMRGHNPFIAVRGHNPCCDAWPQSLLQCVAAILIAMRGHNPYCDAWLDHACPEMPSQQDLLFVIHTARVAHCRKVAEWEWLTVAR